MWRWRGRIPLWASWQFQGAYPPIHLSKAVDIICDISKVGRYFPWLAQSKLTWSFHLTCRMTVKSVKSVKTVKMIKTAQRHESAITAITAITSPPHFTSLHVFPTGMKPFRQQRQLSHITAQCLKLSQLLWWWRIAQGSRESIFIRAFNPLLCPSKSITILISQFLLHVDHSCMCHH